MAASAIKKISLLPGLIISSFLLAATVSDKVNAQTVHVPTNGTQLAWYGGHHGHGWGHGWNHRHRGFGFAPVGWGGGFGPGWGVGFRPGWGGYGPGWGGGFRPGWYGPGYRFINTRPYCQKRCFINRWNRLICATRCF